MLNKNDRARALRAIRSLRPGETTAALLLDARPYMEGSPVQSLRIVVTRHLWPDHENEYHVGLEMHSAGTWDECGGDVVNGWRTGYAEVRACLDFYMAEAARDERSYLDDENTNRSLRIEGVEYSSGFVPYLIGGSVPKPDEWGYPSVCFRVRHEPRDDGRFRVVIEEALYNDPERWEPSTLGFTTDHRGLYDAIAEDKGERGQLVAHFTRLLSAHVEEMRDDLSATGANLPIAVLDDQWAAAAARSRTMVEEAAK